MIELSKDGTAILLDTTDDLRRLARKIAKREGLSEAEALCAHQFLLGAARDLDKNLSIRIPKQETM